MTSHQRRVVERVQEDHVVVGDVFVDDKLQLTRGRAFNSDTKLLTKTFSQLRIALVRCATNLFQRNLRSRYAHEPCSVVGRSVWHDYGSGLCELVAEKREGLAVVASRHGHERSTWRSAVRRQLQHLVENAPDFERSCKGGKCFKTVVYVYVQNIIYHNFNLTVQIFI